MDWNSVAQAFLHSIRSEVGARADAANEIIGQIASWGSHLAKNASERWIVAVADPQPCRHKPKPGHTCGLHALARCDVCSTPVCLAHARIDFLGNAICFGCVRAAMRLQGPVVSDAVVDALKALGLKKTAIWEEIALAYKKAVLKHHPDRATNAKDRAKREAKMKEINAAHATLKKHYEKEAA